MSIASIVGRGFGPDASIAFIVTRGYGLGAPSPVPTELPGHGDYPRFKKSVRPVWDRGPAPPEEIEPDAAAPEPVVEAKKPDLKPGDYENLSRLLAPDLPTPAASKKVRKAKARAVELELPVVLATADLVEAEDTVAGAGIVETLAYGHLVDQDTGLASAEVDVEGSALLYDTDHAAGHASNPIVAKAQITEDADTLSATAAWDDDDLALSLLLGE